MRPLRLDRSLWFAVAALVLAFGVFEFTRLDLVVQDRLYRWDEGRWLIDRAAPRPRLLFYTAPKYVIGAVALTLIGIAWRTRSRDQRRHVIVALLSIISMPLLVGWGKDVTNVFCPWDITRYGGKVPYVRVLERFSPDERPAGRGHGFPAGHASGGFALLALAGLARTRRGQWLGIATGAGAGGTMGFYQMAKGAHFLSHTLATALLAWIVFLLWQRALRPGRAQPAGSRAAGCREFSYEEREVQITR